MAKKAKVGITELLRFEKREDLILSDRKIKVRELNIRNIEVKVVDKTIKELEAIIWKKALGKEDHKVLAHAIICIYNTVMEMKDDDRIQKQKS